MFKVFTYGGALDDKQTTPDRLYTDTGRLDLSGRAIYNAENKVYGTITARQALASSVNTVSARICLDMGRDDFYRYIRQFGFGRPTEIDLGPEIPGIVKRPNTEFWSLYDQAANSFGQGISVTPIQLASAVAAIANGGTLMQPQVVKGAGTGWANVPGGAAPDGTGHQAGDGPHPDPDDDLRCRKLCCRTRPRAGYRVAGKTGTAEVAVQGGYTSKLPITSFAGFLPAADPQIVILVKLVEPRTTLWAEQVVLPIFGQVARDAVRVLKIQPDDRMP